MLDYVYTYNMLKLRRGKRLDLQPTSSSSATSTTSKPVRKLLLAHQRRHLVRDPKDLIGLPIKPDRPLQRCLCPPQLPCLSQTWPRTWVLDNHAFVQFSISVCHLQIRLFNYLQNPHNASLFQSHLSPSASLVVPGLLDWAVSNKARKCSSPILFT